MTSFKDLSISRKLTLKSMILSGSVLLFSCAAFIGYELVTFDDESKVLAGFAQSART